jgi:hypothetical protein
MIPTPLHFLVLTLAGWVNRGQRDRIDYLLEETASLREYLGGKRIRFTDRQRIRLARKARKLGRKALHELDTLVTPDTLLRWYRELVARKYDGSRPRKTGRPATPVSIEALFLRMADENPGCGYTRIRGALMNLGHDVDRTTIQRILQANGLEPSANRQISWTTFLWAHWGAIAAMDFLTVEVFTWTGLVRYLVLFVIDLETTKVEIAGIATPYCHKRTGTSGARLMGGEFMALETRSLTTMGGQFSVCGTSGRRRSEATCPWLGVANLRSGSLTTFSREAATLP